jgi:tetratricopeptide (TPR) repeat protein
MSLLLESLKKAALEKQKKEKNASSQTEVTGKSAIAEKRPEIVAERPAQEIDDLKIEEPVVFDSAEFEFVVEPDQATETLELPEAVQEMKQSEVVQEEHNLKNGQSESSLPESSLSENARPENIQQQEKNFEVKIPEKKEPERNRQEKPAVESGHQNQKPSTDAQNPPIKDNRIPGFTPESGKAALAALLAKNKKIEKSGKKRSIYMVGLLLLTGLGTLGGYYYFLMDNNSSITPTNQMQLYVHENNQSVIDNTATENISTETPQEIVPDAQESAAEIASEENTNANSELNPTESLPVVQEGKSITDNGSNKTLEENNTKRPVTEKPVQKISSPIANSKPAVNSQPIESYIQSHPAVEDTIAQKVNAAYQAYQNGQWLEAQALYQQVLMLDTYNRDALLGAAAVAARQGKPQEALGYYQQQLERDPQDEYAISGIMSLGLDANKNALLSEIDRRLQEKPANVHLLFLKASILAGQQQWSAAQQTFFEAWNYDKNNADIVYNLAICLDRLNQPREAIRFYQMALSLKTTSASFSTANVEKRLASLTESTP